MTEEQKDALIDTAKEDIHFLESVRERRGNLFDLEEHKLALMRIALAALTAPPIVKPYLPDDCDRTEAHYKYDAAIRAAGYEVQE